MTTPGEHRAKKSMDPEVAIDNIRRERKRNVIIYTIGFLAFLVLLVAVWQLETTVADTQDAQRKSNQAAQQNASSITELQALIKQVCQPVQNDSTMKKRVKQQNPNAAEICEQAQRNQLPSAAPSTAPKDGKPGTGIVSVTYTVTRAGCFKAQTLFTDGHLTNSDEVCAPTGKTGPSGKPGASGSPGTQGIPGFQGIGFTNVTCNNDTNVLSFTLHDPSGNTPDNTIALPDACGRGPKGDKGDKGDTGDPGPMCPNGYMGTPATQPDGSSIYQCYSPPPQTMPTP